MAGSMVGVYNCQDFQPGVQYRETGKALWKGGGGKAKALAILALLLTGSVTNGSHSASLSLSVSTKRR
ncbi:unnamed protein product [Rangifer tarandus platyrhynchus]|uniref:Uncharacterized protein n=2 Tax=Rangifer tarandus platyrhynchus TaxID=3082113 RepID=A0ACB0EI80_RANTA|nr:unnamed protein product [Rangifer tarandus platyrhynchus]CAI9700152.1 unnamed protein product [Rangifer tarandus platyrhynchus]